MIENVERAIREYLPSVVHMSLGTSRDNKPWVCEVHVAYDSDLNLYFGSLPSRRHSQDIAVNPRVAGNIVEQHSLDMKPRGVYFEGQAQLLSDHEELDAAFKLYQERFDTDPIKLEEAKADASALQFYKISVDTYYLFDVRDSSPGTKYELPWGSK